MRATDRFFPLALGCATLLATLYVGAVASLAQTATPPPVGKVIHGHPSVVEEVVYQGAKHLFQDDLDHLTNIGKGMPLDPTANNLGCQAIVRKLNEMGRPFASCELLSGGQPGDTKVIFNITEGPVVKVRSVDFVGNTFVSGARLATLITSKSFLGMTYTCAPRMIEAGITKLEEYYKAFGFLDVRVSRELQLTEDGRDVNLVFHIAEGTRYTIQSSPHVFGNKNQLLEQLEQLSKIKPGQFYNQADIDRDITNIKDYYGLTGRDAKVQAIPVFDHNLPGVCRVRYAVEEGPYVHVSSLIFIVGNDRTPERGSKFGSQVPAPLLRVGMTHAEVEEVLGETAYCVSVNGFDTETAFYDKAKVHVTYDRHGTVASFEQR